MYPTQDGLFVMIEHEEAGIEAGHKQTEMLHESERYPERMRNMPPDGVPSQRVNVQNSGSQSLLPTCGVHAQACDAMPLRGRCAAHECDVVLTVRRNCIP